MKTIEGAVRYCLEHWPDCREDDPHLRFLAISVYCPEEVILVSNNERVIDWREYQARTPDAQIEFGEYKTYISAKALALIKEGTVSRIRKKLQKAGNFLPIGWSVRPAGNVETTPWYSQ